MFRIALIALLWGWLVVLGTGHARAQGLQCQPLTVQVPDTLSLSTDQYTAGMGARLIGTLTGQDVKSEYVIVLVGIENVWIVIIRGQYGCPLPPISRARYEQARRPLMGVGG